jgi:hypothetical protein
MMNIMLILIVLPIIIEEIHGNICKELYEEFSLEDRYNKFLEPQENFDIKDMQRLQNIVEVITQIIHSDLTEFAATIFYC